LFQTFATAGITRKDEYERIRSGSGLAAGESKMERGKARYAFAKPNAATPPRD
jgi:hypothetical protein